MINEKLREKIEHSWSDAATAEDKQALLEIMAIYEEEWKEQVQHEFHQDVVLNLQYMPDHEMQEVFGKICSQLGIENVTGKKQSQVRRISILRWMSAAAAAVLIAFGVYSVADHIGKPALNESEATVQSLPESWINNSGINERRTLVDGSVVVLSPNSKLVYFNRMPIAAREISLTGTAEFDVAKDSTRPFTVYAGHLSTTALGTRFTIQSGTEITKVSLHEGKVVVRDTMMKNTAGVYMSPGDELNFDNITNKLIKPKERLQIPAEQTPVEQIVKKSKYRDLEFVQTPIVDVFKTLESRYKVSFEYDETVISDEFVTGKFMANEQLDSVLKILKAVNGFSFERKGNIIIVKK
jgi:ferric-dicitrate binding protein FerR (iron transport regulator)